MQGLDDSGRALAVLSERLLHAAGAETKEAPKPIFGERRIFVNAVEGFLEKNWPFGEPWPELDSDTRTSDSEARARLNAKCIAIVEAKALVTTAIFTERGHTRNMEPNRLDRPTETRGARPRLPAPYKVSL